MTTYHVVESEIDYEACRRLMEAEGISGDITFPTIIALDGENEMVGFLATRPRDDMVLAGPLVMRRDKRRPMTAIRLIDMYRTAMRNMGIRSFIFGIDSDDSFIKKGLARYFPEASPYASNGEGTFYIWPVD